MTDKDSRLIRFNSNLKYLKSLLKNKKRDTVDTSDDYLKLRINEIERDIIMLDNDR